jgi:hypothetical protein
MNKPHPLSLRSLIVTGAIALGASTALAFSRPATIDIDGQRIHSDIPPVTAGHKAYLPLRAVTAGLGARVSYNKKTGTILVERGPEHLKLRTGVRMATLNGHKVLLSSAPFTVRGRTMVAAKTIERALGPVVKYDARKSRIDVFTTDTSVAADQNDSSGDGDAF